MSQIQRFRPNWLPRWQQFRQRWRTKPGIGAQFDTVYRLNFQPLELRESAGFTWLQAALPAIGAGAAFLAWTAAEQCCEAATPSEPSSTVVVNSAGDSMLNVPITPCGPQGSTADEQFVFSARTAEQAGDEFLVIDGDEELPSDVVHGVDVNPTTGRSLGEVETPINHLSDAAPLVGFVGDAVNASLDSAGGGTAQAKAAASDSGSNPAASSAPGSASSTNAGELSNSGKSSSQASALGNDANSAAATSLAEAKIAAAPVAFEQNVGQFDPSVKYAVHGAGYELFLTNSQAVFSLQESNAGATSPSSPSGASMAAAAPEFDVVRMGFVGANITTPQASGLMAEVTNYDIGKDPSQWHTGIANFSSVEYANVYPGIDVVFQPDSQNASQPEFHFVLHPGANPDQIRLSFQGATNIALDSAGDLVVTTKGSKLIEQAPTIYQSGDAGARSIVPGSFVIEPSNSVGFSVGAYDKSRGLVIDPTIEMARNIGDSSDSDVETGVAIYSNGDAAISGYTSGSDFPVDNAAQSSLAGSTDATFVKLDPSGNILIATYLGGSEPDVESDPPSGASQHGTAIAIGPDNSTYMVGYTDATDFPLTEDAYQSSLFDGSDLYAPQDSSFLTVFDSSGDITYSSYVYQHNSGSLSMWTDPINGEHFGIYSWQVQLDMPTGVAVDSDGTAYVSGWTDGFIESEALPPPPSNPPGDPKHVYDGFAYSMSTDGTMNWMIWQSGHDNVVDNYGIAGNGKAQANGIALSPDQSSVYVVGMTSSTSDSPVTSGAFQTTMGGSTYDGSEYNGFVLQLDASTGDVNSGTYLGGSFEDNINGVAVDSDGNVYVTGETQSTDFPTQSPLQSELNTGDPTGNPNTFITKFDSSLSSVSYSTYFGGDATSGGNWGNGIGVDSDGNMDIIGGGLLGDTVNTIASSGGAFMAQVSADGSTVNYATPLGSGTNDTALGVAVDSSENAWGVGATDSGLPSGEITYTGSNPGTGFVIVLGTS